MAQFGRLTFWRLSLPAWKQQRLGKKEAEESRKTAWPNWWVGRTLGANNNSIHVTRAAVAAAVVAAAVVAAAAATNVAVFDVVVAAASKKPDLKDFTYAICIAAASLLIAQVSLCANADWLITLRTDIDLARAPTEAAATVYNSSNKIIQQ